MPIARLEILGTPRVRGPDGADSSIRGLHAALLAYLVLQRRPLLREHLGTLFWPGTGEARAKHSLRQALSVIRSALPDVVEEGGDPVAVTPGALETDVQLFEEHLREHRVAEALALRRGPFLDGFRRPASWELEDWMERKRSELDTLLAETALHVGEAWTEGGSPLQAAALLAEVAAALPGREDLVLARILALAVAGRLPEAEGVLAGLEPDPEDEDREEVVEFLAQAWREQELQALVAPPPVQVETTDVAGAVVAPDAGRPGTPPSAVRPEPRHRRWRHPLWLAAASVASLPLLLGRVPGMNGVPAPVPPAEIWFCAPRETESTHRMNQDGGAKQSLGVHGCPVIPVNGGSRLVAMQGRDGHWGVLVVDDGGERFFPMPFTSGHFNLPMQQAGPMDGVVSPDGRWLVVTGEHPLEEGPDPVSNPPGSSRAPAVWNVYMVDLETGEVDQLTDHPARDFDARFSPDGSRVVFASERTGGGDIYVLEMADRSVRRVTSHPDKEVDPAIHGDQVVFQRGSGNSRAGEFEDIILVSLKDGTERRITANAWNETGAEFSRDGTKLCWTSKRDGHWEADIMVVDLVRGRSWPAASSPGRNDWCSWHPGADVVFFQTWRDGNAEIYRTSIGPREPSVNLTRHPADDEKAAVVVGGR